MSPELLTHAIQEFKEIYLEEFGIELSNEEATEKAQGVLQLFDSLTKGDSIK